MAKGKRLNSLRKFRKSTSLFISDFAFQKCLTRCVNLFFNKRQVQSFFFCIIVFEGSKQSVGS